MGILRTEFQEGGTVAVIRMTNGENRINLAFLTELNKALDSVERNPAVRLLITTGEDKFYSNGLDLQWISENKEKQGEFRNFLKRTFKRLLSFPVVTVAAINGHAFAAGAMLAMMHDLRVMKQERGWISLNEIFIGMVPSQSMIEIFRSKLPSGPLYHSIFVFGKRFTAKDSLDGGLVNAICPGDELMSMAAKVGRGVIGKQEFDRDVLSQMKLAVYKRLVELLDTPEEIPRLSNL